MKKALIMLLALTMTLALCSGFAYAEEEEIFDPIFELAEGDDIFVEAQVFSEDVTISGDNAVITFEGCEFAGDIVINSAVATRVQLIECTVEGKCIFDNGVKEGNIDTVFPKVLTTSPVEAVTMDCYGSVVVLGDFEIIYNGETYSLADSEVFYDSSKPEEGMVPYDGQEANVFYIGQWWEDGELTMFLECEY